MRYFNERFHLRRYIPVIALALLFSDVHSQRLDCDPCINREKYKIKAIVHGTVSDEKWTRVRLAALQTAADMNVDFEMNLYGSYDIESDDDKMINDIRAAVQERSDALIVSIPSMRIAQEVENTLARGMPIFAINAGDEYAGETGIVDFFGMDRFEAGKKAAEEMIRIKTIVKKALFIEYKGDDLAFEETFAGYEETIDEHAAEMDELATVEQAYAEDSSNVADQIINCDWDAVLLSDSVLIDAAKYFKEDNECNFVLGTFDTNKGVYEAISAEHIDFAVSEQSFLEGAISVLMASVYATTGMKIVPPTSKTHIYATGPKIITLDNVPSNTFEACQAEGFPVCSDTTGTDPRGNNAGQCKCTIRKNIKIAGVLHGVTTDVFWDPVFAATQHAADDMGIDLILDRFDPVDDQTVLHEKMRDKMIDLCEQEIDGLFVTIPSGTVKPGLERCKELSIPIVSINTGKEISEELNLLHHVGMLEYNAGYGAGKRMILNGMKRGLCLDHEPGNTALVDRCRGFGDAIEEDTDVTYLGKLDVPLDNAAMYKKTVEDKINEDGDWDGIGLFLLGPAQTNDALNVQQDHPKTIMGSVDTSDEIYNAIDEKKILFGITQGPYMQGYMPIPILTWLKYTEQSLTNKLIESGPTFVETSPSEALQTCESNLFSVCRTVPKPDAPSVMAGPSYNETALIASLVVIFGVLFIVVGFVAYRMHKLNKHVSELEQQGQTVPDLSFREKMSGVVKPVESVVSARMA